MSMEADMKSIRSSSARVTGTTSTAPDDGVRGGIAVVVSLDQRSDGTVRVVFDDAQPAAKGMWSTTGLFTSRDYSAESFMDMDLDPAEFESAGVGVLSRLMVMTRRLKR